MQETTRWADGYVRFGSEKRDDVKLAEMMRALLIGMKGGPPTEADVERERRRLAPRAEPVPSGGPNRAQRRAAQRKARRGV